ncbi:hypothetical protein ACHAWF_014336 [Thalassiosira exigua]
MTAARLSLITRPPLSLPIPYPYRIPSGHRGVLAAREDPSNPSRGKGSMLLGPRRFIPALFARQPSLRRPPPTSPSVRLLHSPRDNNIMSGYGYGRGGGNRSYGHGFNGDRDRDRDGGGGGGRGRGRGRGGRGGGGGYDWRKHTRASSDPVVQNEVREAVQRFLDSGLAKQEISCGGEEKNTYKQYCKQMGVGWAKGSTRGSYKLIRFVGADPSMTLWKKVWCFYFRHYCHVDLLAESSRNNDAKVLAIDDTKVLAIDDTTPTAWDDFDDNDTDDAKPAAWDAVDDTDVDEATAILRLKENDHNDVPDADAGADSARTVLDSTSDSLDGRRMWTKVRDLLQDIKRTDGELWENCCSLGVNNCSERKLESHVEQVGKFFDLQGRGPSQKIRGKKLRVAIEPDESVHFMDGGESFEVEFAKPVKFCDTKRLEGLIRLVDNANLSLGVHASSKGDGSPGTSEDDDHLPFNIFNDNWRLHSETTDPTYLERKRTLRGRLPAFEVGEEFCKRVFENDVVVLCGATGSGKSTQLPQILMEAAAKLMHEQHSGMAENDKRRFGTGRIICTQPRRISATSVAERVCFERNERMGDRVGYQIRFEQKATDTTELLYCTTGIVLRFLVGNPKLEGISCVIIDEVHERGVHTDFVLLILKDLVLERQRQGAEPLKIVLMSATIDASSFIRYFDPSSGIQFNNMSMGDDSPREGAAVNSSTCPFSVSFLQIKGKTNYPIKEYFIEDICKEIPSLVVSGPPPMSFNRGGRNGSMQEMRNPWASAEAVRSKYRELGLRIQTDGNHVWKQLSNALQRPFRLDVDLICKVVKHIEDTEEQGRELGSILIFVPGWQDITSVIKELDRTLLDCRKRHDWARNRTWDTLPLHSQIPQKEQISRSNVQQRRGRAGRCQPGQFFKLYSQYEFLHEMRDHELPEMLRTPVEELCLQAKSLRLPGDLTTHKILEKAINPPEALAVDNAVQLLTELGAFEDDERMTPLGWRLSQLPLHPCLGKMLLLGSLFTKHSSCPNPPLKPLIQICSTLSFKSPFVLPFGKEKEADRARKKYGQGLLSDHMLFSKVMSEYNTLKFSRRGELYQWLDKNFLSKKTLENIEKIHGDLERHLKDLKVNDPSDFALSSNAKLSSRGESFSIPLLYAILQASLGISFLSPGKKKLCSLRGGSACSVHPSSLLSMIEAAGNERMLWRKYKHVLRQSNDEIAKAFVLDHPDKIFV